MPLTRVRSQLISVPTNYPITGSLSGTASYATTASFAMNGGSGGGGTLQTGSFANQTILYNVTTSQDNTITGLNLINNKWGVTVVEEWNSASVVGDAYYSSCSVLFHFSGSNGSTSIIDNGPNNVTSTVSGATVITSSFSKFGSSSLFLGGTNGNYLTIPVVSGGPLDVNNQDFTVECYIYITATTNGLIASRYNSNAGSGNYNWDFSIVNGKLQSYISQYNNNNSYNLIAGATSVTTGSWHHVAFVRSSSFQTLFLDGNKDVSGSITVTSTNSSQAIRIGTSVNSDGSTNAPIVGYIDDFRITKGIARYTASFTTSSLEFPNNTSSIQYATKYIGLVGGLNDSTVDYGVEKLSDSSLKIRKMSASGQPLSGSGNLSASVDRVYVNVLNYDNVSISGSIPSASYALTASYAMNGGGGGGSTSLTGITFPYVSGSNTYTLSQSAVAANDLLLSVNGVVQTPTTDYTVSSSTVTFTDSYPSGSSVNVRYLVSATSSSFVDLNNIVLTGTTTGDAYYPQVSALLHFDGVNGSTVITDNSKNIFTVTAYNGAAISTTRSKFGGASCFFDGTNDYVLIPANNAFAFGNDFTVECWFYCTAASLSSGAIALFGRNAYGYNYNGFPRLSFTSTSKLLLAYAANTYITCNTTVTLNAWHHVAIVRYNGTITVYLDGIADGTVSYSTAIPATYDIVIGDAPWSSVEPHDYYQGYIDEFRVTNGYARYTSNFTPSTTAFADGGGDVGKALVVNSTATGVSIGTAGFNLNSSNINRIINGAMAIDQRNAGASQTITAAAALAYTVDRWYGYCTGANVTSQRVSGSGANQYVYRFTGAASVTAIGFAQRIEAANCYDLASSTVTLGVDLANSLLTTVTWTAYYANTADTFGTLASPTRTQIATGTFTVTSTSTRYSTQIFIPSAATTGIEIVFTVGAQTSGTWTIGNVQLEAGPLATPFERRNIAQELVNCQRYYSKSYAINTVPGTVTNLGCITIEGLAGGPTYLGHSTKLPVVMRTTPNIAYYSPTSATSGRIGYWNGTAIAATTSYASGSSGITDSSVSAQLNNINTSAIYWHYTADAEL